MEIIDCHVHICPDNLAERNREIIEKFSGITPVYDGSIGNLLSMMVKNKISKAIVNNTVLKTELMSKANDFTAQVASKNANLIPMSWIVPGAMGSPDEVDRCGRLGFKGVKIHNSHFKILPSDSKNDKMYEKIVENRLPVLFHCGFNPYSKSGEIQYAIPKNFLPVIESFPEMKVVLGHLAGYQDDRRAAIEVVNSSQNVFADLALDPKRGVDFKQILKEFAPSKLLFGSDYPIHGPELILSEIEKLNESDSKGVLSQNTASIFSLD